MRLSIVMPAYNEEKRIGRTLEKYCHFFDNKISGGFSYVILVVINGTKDDTEGVVKKCQKRWKNIEYLNFSRGGKGFAITEGFKHSLERGFDYIGFVDADLATSPEEFWKLVKEIGNYDGAIADRYIKGAKIIPAFSFRRLVVSRVFNFIVKALFQLSYNDTQCGAKLFRKEAIEKTLKDLVITQWAYDVNLLYSFKKKNLRIKSIPTVWYEAEGSSLNINKASIQMLFAIIQLRIITSPFKPFLKIIKPFMDLAYKIVK